MRLLPLLALFLALSYGSTLTSVRGASIESTILDCRGVYDLCGYISQNTGQVVIPRKFERALPFEEGVAAVKINGRYGYIDTSGTFVIPPVFDHAGSFYQGLAEVMIGGNAGVIDRTGSTVVVPQFARTVPFTRDVILVEVHTQNLGDRTEWLEALSNVAGNLSLDYDFNWGLYDIRKGWITKPIYRLQAFEGEGRGLIWASMRDGGLIGLLQADGRWRLTPRFSNVRRLHEGRAVVTVSNKGTDLDGAVDQDGRIVVPPKPWHLTDWQAGAAEVSNEKLTRIGLGKAKRALWFGMIDSGGRLIGSRMFASIDRAVSSDEVFRVFLKKRWKGLTRHGRIVGDPDAHLALTDCRFPRTKRTSLMRVRVRAWRDGAISEWKHRLDCDAERRLRLNPPVSTRDADFLGGHLAIELRGKWGIVGTDGIFTVSPRFDSAQPLLDGVFRVTRGTRVALVDAYGRDKSDPLDEFTRGYYYCDSETKFVSKDGLWGLSDLRGAEIIPPTYRAVQCYRGGLAWVAVDAKRHWCPVGVDGAIREGSQCRSSHYPLLIPFFWHVERFAEDGYESSVLWTRAFLDWRAGRRENPPYVGNGTVF